MCKAIERADKFVGERCKIFYPWKQVYVYRVVYKDYKGYYVRYGGSIRRLRVAVDEFGGFMSFEMLHGKE